MSEKAGLTPSQTVGPYLSIGLFREHVSSTPVGWDEPDAVRISGLLLDGAGEPVADGMVELWQADVAGNYASGTFGRSATAPDGRFELVTRKPGRVPWPEGGLQAPHLILGVFARGLLKRLVTRMYFPDEMEANATDPVLSRLDDRARETLVARPDGDGLRFDIVLQGEGETTFFAI